MKYRDGFGLAGAVIGAFILCLGSVAGLTLLTSCSQNARKLELEMAVEQAAQNLLQRVLNEPYGNLKPLGKILQQASSIPWLSQDGLAQRLLTSASDQGIQIELGTEDVGPGQCGVVVRASKAGSRAEYLESFAVGVVSGL